MLKNIILENKKCPHCGADFVTKPRAIPKKFCSEKCRTRYNSRIRYSLVKDTDEYKNYRKEYFPKWLDNNRSHFNDLCRDRSRIGAHNRYIERVKKGLCAYCGGIKEEERKNKRICIACSKKAQVYEKRYRTKLKSNVPT